MPSLRIAVMAPDVATYLECLGRRPEIKLVEQKPLDARQTVYSLHVECPTPLSLLLFGVDIGREFPLGRWERTAVRRAAQEGGVVDA